MSAEPDRREWPYLRTALGVVALIVVADVIAWKVHDLVQAAPLTRLEQNVRCLSGEKGLETIVPAGDPISDTADEGSLRATVEGNEVTVSLAADDEQAIRIERNYHLVGGELPGRLERRFLTVYLWAGVASPTQRQTMYDCQY